MHKLNKITLKSHLRKVMNSDTKILMYSGKIKKLKDIVIGDFIMGINNTKIKVIDTFVLLSESSNTFKIKQKFGDDYVVSGNTFLLLKLKNNKKVIRGSSNSNNNSLEEYFQVGWYSRQDSSWFTKNFKEYKEANNFSNKLQSCDTIKITASELFYNKHLIPHCLGQFSQVINFSKETEFRASQKILSPYLVGVWIGKKECYIPEITAFLKQCGNTIPDEYLLGDIKIRKELLSGILDSKGVFLEKFFPLAKYNCFQIDISKATKDLLESILFLARSLGYIAYTTVKSKIYIIGNFNNLNLQIKRKFRDYTQELVTGIDIINESSSNSLIQLKLDSQIPFLLGDFTIATFN